MRDGTSLYKQGAVAGELSSDVMVEGNRWGSFVFYNLTPHAVDVVFEKMTVGSLKEALRQSGGGLKVIRGGDWLQEQSDDSMQIRVHWKIPKSEEPGMSPLRLSEVQISQRAYGDIVVRHIKYAVNPKVFLELYKRLLENENAFAIVSLPILYALPTVHSQLLAGAREGSLQTKGVVINEENLARVMSRIIVPDTGVQGAIRSSSGSILGVRGFLALGEEKFQPTLESVFYTTQKPLLRKLRSVLKELIRVLECDR